MEGADLVSATDLEGGVDAIDAEGRAALLDRGDRDLADDHGADEHRHDRTEARSVDGQRDALVLHEEVRDVPLTDGVDWIEVAGDAAHELEQAVDGAVYAMIVARGE